jgi:hypothetical protein
MNSEIIVQWFDPDGLPRAYATGDIENLNDVVLYSIHMLKAYCDNTISNEKNMFEYTMKMSELNS